MNDSLYDRIDNMYIDGLTADDLSIDTKVDVVMDFFDKVEEMETRVVNYEMILVHLKDILSFYMNIPINKEIDEKIADLITNVYGELENYNLD